MSGSVLRRPSGSPQRLAPVPLEFLAGDHQIDYCGPGLDRLDRQILQGIGLALLLSPILLVVRCVRDGGWL